MSLRFSSVCHTLGSKYISEQPSAEMANLFPFPFSNLVAVIAKASTVISPVLCVFQCKWGALEWPKCPSLVHSSYTSLRHRII